MSWFSKKPKVEESAAPPPTFKMAYFDESVLGNVSPHIRQLADEADEAGLREAFAGMELPDQMGLAAALAMPPATCAKVAMLSLMLQAQVVSDVASHALWQQLMSQASDEQVALLRKYERTTPPSADYDAAFALVGGLMSSVLGRDLKVGEMEGARQLVGRFLRLAPATLLS